MPFNNIDSPGNRRDRRAVAALQRANGAAGRKDAADKRRAKRADKRLLQDLNRTILFYAEPERGFVAAEDEDGAYVMNRQIGNQRQIIVAGELRASVDHYVKAIGIFLKKPVRLVKENPIPTTNGREFRSIIVEVI